METKEGNKKVLLGQRIRSMRKAKRLTQEELGARAEVSYKFIGEIERGQQNPSFDVLVKIADALDIDLFELFHFDLEISKRKDIEVRMSKIFKGMAEDDLRKMFFIFRGLFPHI